MTEQQEELIPKGPGLLLREERKRQGLTVTQIAERIHVRERIIRAIEAEDTANIAPVYLSGFVKSYALGLGLDAEELSLAARDSSGPDPELKSVFVLPPKRGAGERWLKAGSYLVASVLVAALVWQVTQQAVQFADGQSPLTRGAQDSSSKDADAEMAAAPRPATSGNHLAASIASLEKLSESRNQSSSTAAEEAWKALRSGEANNPQSQGEDGSAVINLKVSADSWVEIIDANGAHLEQDLLRGGNQRSYSGEPPFELMFGRASAVELEFNGLAVDLSPHIDGDVARLTLGEAETPSN